MQSNTQIDLAADLIDLATYRKKDRVQGNLPDPVIIFVAYAQDEYIYDKGRIALTTAETYAVYKTSSNPALRNLLVNKFGLVYKRGMPLFMHRRLADVLVDTAIDMRDRYRQFTVVMDGLRTYEAAGRMQVNRPDLVASGMLAPPGASAHNRALAVDSKLFELINPDAYGADITLDDLQEADEHGHLDDEQDMTINSRFYSGPMSDDARRNRSQRLIAWQRASVKNRTPIANLLAEFWDDRVPGSPADLWRVLVCRALCVGIDANPTTNPIIQQLKNNLSVLQGLPRPEFAHKAYQLFIEAWNLVFTHATHLRLEALLGPHSAIPPALEDFLFHEWLGNIHDNEIEAS